MMARREPNVPQMNSRLLLRITNYSDKADWTVAALSSAPKNAGQDTGATENAVTIICKPQ